MKRKSQELSPTSLRSPRHHKTQGCISHPQGLRDADGWNWSEVIGNDIVKEITQAIYEQIYAAAHRQLLQMVIGDCSEMAAHIAEFLNPAFCQVSPHQTQADQQPHRINYDPICGFDKLITLKNDPNKSLIAFPQSGTSQYPKKQCQKLASIVLASSSSSPRLVPLDMNRWGRPTTQEKEDERQQAVMRDRLIQSRLKTVANAQQPSKMQSFRTSKLVHGISKLIQVD